MRFFLDANMPRSAVSALTKLGHQVEFARDIGMAGSPDEAIAAHARTTQAAIVTRDVDFADVRRYPPEEYADIVVLRLPDDAVASEVASVLERQSSGKSRTSPTPSPAACCERHSDCRPNSPRRKPNLRDSRPHRQ